MLIAAIPTMEPGAVVPLLKQIARCKVKPDFTLIFNNSKTPIDIPLSILGSKKFYVFNNNGNIGVNAVWNKALEIASAYNAHLSLLNDDIELLSDDFFSDTLAVLNDTKSAGVVCPNTDSGKGFAEDKRKEIRFINMKRKEGWAFTIKNDLVHSIPPIPKELFIFFGDDWIFRHSLFLGYFWIKDLKNKIKHKVGFTLHRNMKLRKKLEYERNAFRAIISNLDRS